MTRKQYQDWLALSLKSSYYFVFMEAFLEILNHREAIVLQMLLNLPENSDGWRMCTVEFLEAKGKLDRNAQQVVLGKFVEMGIVRVKRMGCPPRRYVQVDRARICELLEPYLSDQNTRELIQHETMKIDYPEGNQSTPNGENHLTPNNVTPSIDKRMSVRKDESKTPLTPQPRQPSTKQAQPTPVVVQVKRNARRSLSSQDQEPQPPPDPDLTHARHLHETILTKGLHRFLTPPDLNKWAKEFRALRLSLKSDAHLIPQALDWYRDHCQGKYALQCHCAKTFRDKFDRLLSKMSSDSTNGDSEGDAKSQEPPLVLTPNEELLIDLVMEYRWPLFAEDNVKRAAVLTYRASNRFFGQIHQLKDQGRLSDSLIGLATHLEACWYSAVSFARGYMEKVFRKNADWDDWDGNVRPCVPGTKQFYREGLAASTDYTSNANLFRDLMRALGH